MSESIEYLIEFINNNIKSESENIQEYIKEISIIQNTENNIKLEDICDGLSHSLKITRRSKLLRNKYKRIQSEINELSHYVYKPEEMDSDDELQWEREEMYGKSYTMKSNDTTDSEYESESESESETESEKLRNTIKHIGPKITNSIDEINKKNDEEDTKPTIKFNRESKSI